MKVRDLFVQITVGIRDAGAKKLADALDGIVKSAGKAAPALDAAEKAAAKQAREAERAAAKIERAEKAKAREAERSAATQARAAAAAERAVVKAEKAKAREAEKAAHAVEKAERLKAREYEKAQRALDKATRESIRDFEKQAAAAERNVARLDRSIAKLTSQNAALAKRRDTATEGHSVARMENLGNLKSDLGDAGAGLAEGAVAYVGGLAAAGTLAIQTAGQFESLRAQLTNVEGDQAKANKTFAHLKELAATTPFQLEQLTEAYIALRVRGVEPTDEKITALGDLSSTFGYGMQEMTEAISAVARGENDPIEKFGITARKVGDQVKLSFKDQTVMVDQTANAITDALVEFGKMDGVAGAMAGQMKTLKGAWSNFEDAMSNAVDKAMQESGALDEVKKILGLLTSTADGAAGALGTVLVDALSSLREWLASLTQEDIEGFFNDVVNAGMAMNDMIQTAIGFVLDFVTWLDKMTESIGPADGAMAGLALTFGALVLAGGGLPGLFAATAVGAAQLGMAIADYLDHETLDRIWELEQRIKELKATLGDLDVQEQNIRDDLNNTTYWIERGLTMEQINDAKSMDEAYRIDFRRNRADQRFEAAAKAAREGFGEEFFATAEEQGGMLETQGRGGILTAEQKAIAATGGRNVGIGAAATRANLALAAAEKQAIEQTVAQAKASAKNLSKSQQQQAIQAATAARTAGMDAKRVKARQAFTEAMRKGMSEEDAIAAAEAELLDTPKAKKGRKGKKDKEIDILEQLGLKGPGSILQNRPSPDALTVSLVINLKVADKIEVPITMPAGTTFEGTAQQAGETAGMVVQDAMMDKIVQGVEATLALRLDDFAAMRGGGRVPARRRSK